MISTEILATSGLVFGSITVNYTEYQLLISDQNDLLKELSECH